jgi:protein TonB
MAPATTFRFDSATRSDRTTSRLEFAAALAVVVVLHVALAVWVLRSRGIPLPPPEPPRTIVAQLLSAPPPAPPRPAVAPAPTPPRPAPARPVEPPHPAPPARVKAPVTPRPVHHETPVLAHETPTPAAAPAAPEPAAPPTPATPPAATTAPPATAASAQSPAANAAPKQVSHVDCNIGQPAYPVMSQRHNETGTAVVRFVVGADGHVESAKILHSSGYARLDDAALDAVRGGTCRPWKEAGVPVRVAYAQPFVFGLGN